MCAGVAEGYVIGVDLGGTKLLAGAVGADLSMIHRTNRPVYGLSQDELVQMVADAVGSLLADPERARAMGTAGRERVLRAHTWPAIAARLASWLGEAAEAPTPR